MIEGDVTLNELIKMAKDGPVPYYVIYRGNGPLHLRKWWMHADGCIWDDKKLRHNSKYYDKVSSSIPRFLNYWKAWGALQLQLTELGNERTKSN